MQPSFRNRIPSFLFCTFIVYRKNYCLSYSVCFVQSSFHNFKQNLNQEVQTKLYKILWKVYLLDLLLMLYSQDLEMLRFQGIYQTHITTGLCVCCPSPLLLSYLHLYDWCCALASGNRSYYCIIRKFNNFILNNVQEPGKVLVSNVYHMV